MEPLTKTPPAEKFRTWFAKLPIETGRLLQKAIKEKLEWSSQVWYDRMHNRTEFKPAEKFIIQQLAAEFNQPNTFADLC